MKIGIILSLLIVLTIYSCKKDDAKATDTNYYITALKNNNAWAGTPFAGMLGDTLFIQGGTNFESLRMKIKFNNTGKYIVTGNQSDYILTTGGVAVSEAYTLRTDTVSSVTIFSYDADKQIYEGTFDLSFIRSSPATANQPKIHFSKGNFRIPRGGFAL